MPRLVAPTDTNKGQYGSHVDPGLANHPETLSERKSTLLERLSPMSLPELLDLEPLGVLLVLRGH